MLFLKAERKTPGAVRYATWRSHCDLVILPTDSVMLSGAANTMVDGCVGHLSLPNDAAIYTQVRAWIDR